MSTLIAGKSERVAKKPQPAAASATRSEMLARRVAWRMLRHAETGIVRGAVGVPVSPRDAPAANHPGRTAPEVSGSKFERDCCVAQLLAMTAVSAIPVTLKTR